jgi:hypothetical protein
VRPKPFDPSLQEQYRARMASEAETIRKRAETKAQAHSHRELKSLQQRLKTSDNEQKRAVAKAVREVHASFQRQLKVSERKLKAAESSARVAARKAAKQAANEVTRSSRQELALVKERSAKERAQHAAETAGFKARIDEMSVRLERQTSGQMGEMTEADALTALKRAFPSDNIQRIGRGVRGADILHKVMLEGAEIGCIVYECKNATSWQNEWLAKARSYRTQYQTDWVIVASRCFPRKAKWFVVERDIPVIELRLIVSLAEVVRSAILEIGSLRLTTDGRQAKADQMLKYILSEAFRTRFKAVAEVVTSLRSQQDKERRWHSEAWAKQTRMYDDIESSRRDIASQVRAITEGSPKTRLRVLAG